MMKFGGIFFLVAPSGDLDICPQREICNGQRVIGRLRSPIQARASTGLASNRIIALSCDANAGRAALDRSRGRRSLPTI
jgi:hypothetical protein